MVFLLLSLSHALTDAGMAQREVRILLGAASLLEEVRLARFGGPFFRLDPRVQRRSAN